MENMKEPKCPKCGGNSVFVRQNEVAYYHMDYIEKGAYQIGHIIDGLWECRSVRIECGDCAEELEQEDLEKSSGVE